MKGKTKINKMVRSEINFKCIELWIKEPESNKILI